MEKQAFSLVRSLKHFKTYVGYSKIVCHVPHTVVKDILCQQDCLGKRDKEVSKIQEYDLEIKPTKLIKGQGLAKMLTQGNEEALGIICQNEEPTPSMPPKLQRLDQHWYSDIILFPQNLTCLEHLKGHNRRALRLKVVR